MVWVAPSSGSEAAENLTSNSKSNIEADEQRNNFFLERERQFSEKISAVTADIIYGLARWVIVSLVDDFSYLQNYVPKNHYINTETIAKKSKRYFSYTYFENI